MPQTLALLYLFVASAIFLVGSYRIMEGSRRYGDDEALGFFVLVILVVLWPAFAASQALRWALDKWSELFSDFSQDEGRQTFRSSGFRNSK